MGGRGSSHIQGYLVLKEICMVYSEKEVKMTIFAEGFFFLRELKGRAVSMLQRSGRRKLCCQTQNVMVVKRDSLVSTVVSTETHAALLF